MTKKERIRGILEGRPMDRTPAGFQLHFPEEMYHGEEAIEARLDFMKATDTDVLKIMNRNILYNRNTKIERLDDINEFRRFSRKDAIFQNQMEIIRRIANRAKGRYPIVSTVHGLIVSAFRETGFADNYTSMGCQLALFCQERLAEMKKMFRTVTRTLMEFSDCSLEAGAESILHAALGGGRNLFTDEEFKEFVAPYEKMVYDHIRKTTDFNVLHIYKSNIGFNRYRDLYSTVMNWGTYGNDFSLTKGAGLFGDSIILGGFSDRRGVLVAGTEEEIFKHTSEILEEMKERPFIMGSDCTLSAETAYDHI